MKQGFSLIELLVVVTIIGALAAIAMPVYTKYSARAKIGASFNVSSALINAAHTYAVTKGAFPNANQLGYSTISGGGYPVNSAISGSPSNSFVTYQVVGDTCGQSAYMATHFNLFAIPGVVPSNVTVLGYIVEYFNINNTIQRYCVYFEGDNASTWYNDDALFPGCTNQYAGGNSTAYTAQHNALLAKASCM